jgi:hypothetical protein
VEIDAGATKVTPLDFVAIPTRTACCALRLGRRLRRDLRRDQAFAVARGGRAALLVVSHWVLDVLMHRPDMPLTVSGSTKLGLGLWSSVPGARRRAGVFLVGFALYALDRRAIESARSASGRS